MQQVLQAGFMAEALFSEKGRRWQQWVAGAYAERQRLLSRLSTQKVCPVLLKPHSQRPQKEGCPAGKTAAACPARQSAPRRRHAATLARREEGRQCPPASTL